MDARLQEYYELQDKFAKTKENMIKEKDKKQKRILEDKLRALRSRLLVVKSILDENKQKPEPIQELDKSFLDDWLSVLGV